MHLPVIGLGKTIGGSHLYALSLELLGVPKTLKRLEHWRFPVAVSSFLAHPVSYTVMVGTLKIYCGLGGVAYRDRTNSAWTSGCKFVPRPS